MTEKSHERSQINLHQWSTSEVQQRDVIIVRNSDFIFVPRSGHADQFTFHISLLSLKFNIFIPTNTNTKCPLLNYLLLIAKIYLRDRRRTQILPNITGFKLKVKNKFETEKYVCTKNNTLDKFNKKWLTISK